MLYTTATAVVMHDALAIILQSFARAIGRCGNDRPSCASFNHLHGPAKQRHD